MNLEECKCCDKKATTMCPSKCPTYIMTNAGYEINEFIEEHLDNIDNYEFYINEDYKDLVLKHVNLKNISQKDIHISKMMEVNELCIIVDKVRLDWGNVPIEFGGI